MIQSVDSPRLSLPARYLLGVLLIVAASLLIFNLVLNPPMSEIGLMAVYLAVTAVISALAGYTLYRLGWLYRAPTLRWAMISAYALSSALTFLNVWLAAWQMFADQHDLQQATVLLLFAAGMAMVLGYFLSTALADRIRQLDRAAQAIAEGDLGARASVAGRDELATLADTFNRMAAQLQAAARKQVPPIHKALERRLGYRVASSSVYRILARHGWRKVTPDTCHPKHDAEAQEEFKKNGSFV